MLLAIVLCLHGNSVKDYLPPSVERVRRVARVQLMVWGVKPGMTIEEARALIGFPTFKFADKYDSWDYYYPSLVDVSYRWKKGEKDQKWTCVVEEVSRAPLHKVFLELLK
jgi:hypothetical protein